MFDKGMENVKRIEKVIVMNKLMPVFVSEIFVLNLTFGIFKGLLG